jgi:hypothetical protein
MSADFSKSKCAESPRIDLEFGICDDQNNTKAYTDNKYPHKWIAVVKNNADPKSEVTFTPIDKCIVILKQGSNDEERVTIYQFTPENSKMRKPLFGGLLLISFCNIKT